MKKHAEHTPSNFWFGFALGSVVCVTATYLMGTKKGRESLKKALEYAENMGEAPEELLELIPTLRDLLKDHTPEEVEQMPAEEPPNQKNTLDTLMEKMRFTENKKEGKKFFVKSGKIDNIHNE